MTTSPKNANAPARERRGGMAWHIFCHALYCVARSAELPFFVLLLAICFLLVLAVAK